MIRKMVVLAALIFLFIYAAWNFYTNALAYRPLTEEAAKRSTLKEDRTKVEVAYEPAWSKVIMEKNLFNPGRTYREPKPVPAGPPPVPEKRPEFVLKGIILDSFGEYVAYLEVDKSKPVALRKGDKIEKTEIVDVSGRQAVLKWNGEIINLSLEKIKTIDNTKGSK